MARKNKAQVYEDRKRKRQQEQDLLLETGAFSGVEGEITQEYVEAEADHGRRNKKARSWDDEEQSYELQPRKVQEDEYDMVEGLPIKINGKIERKMIAKTKKGKQPEDPESEEEVDESLKQSANGSKENDEQEEDEEPDTEEKIVALKEEIAELVGKLMDEPEENPMALTRLVKMTKSKNPNTCIFSILALVSVFKSIIPGYRIRPLTELEKKEKVSKEVARLRTFEQGLVANYKNYLDTLKELAKTPNNADPIKITMGIRAVQAATELASPASHFNYRSELFTILVRRICKPNLSADQYAPKIIKTIETLFNDDDEGNISVEFLRLLAKTIKTRNYMVEESVINMFLSLDVLHDYDPNTKSDNEPVRMKLKKKDRVHLSKKQRKARKEMKQIEEEMARAEQTVSAEEREKNQSEILQTVLALYLNFLRSENPKLIGAALEGLTKFGNQVNFDMLGDFLAVMKEIITEAQFESLSADEVRKILLCIVSAFSLVSNHNTIKFSVDLSTFVNGLYTVLPYVAMDADIEFSYKSLRLADPLENEVVKPSVNVSTKAELLLKALNHVFFRSRSGTRDRAAAFTKRIYICIQHTPEKTSIALLKFLDKLMSRFPEIGSLYSTEDRVLNGNFDMYTDAISRSNPTAAMLWENAILEKHYCPIVVKGIKALSTRSKDHK
ncbi:Noc3p [Nakaseomyces bracarensis]|uniref:Noc3p n=1 Tax=Nakaseomyces bracarensis TaxID=273131 RepID=UPI003872202C